MTETFRVLVTGSRTWLDATCVEHRLIAALDLALLDGKDLVVIHGACPQGADAHAAQWCRDMASSKMSMTEFAHEERHPADWRKHGRAAGFKRNEEMVALGANLCLAFVSECADPKCRKPKPHGTHGAIDCASRAEKAGIETRYFGWNPHGQTLALFEETGA